MPRNIKLSSALDSIAKPFDQIVQNHILGTETISPRSIISPSASIEQIASNREPRSIFIDS